MPIICRNIPNRTERRPFSPSDVARIAKRVEDEGFPVLEVFGAVAIALGLGVLLCKVARMMRASSVLIRFVRQLAIVAASALAVRTVITALLKSPLATVPIVRVVLATVVAILLVVDRIVRRFRDLADDLADFDAVFDTINEACDAVGNAASSAAARGKEVGQDLFDELARR